MTDQNNSLPFPRICFNCNKRTVNFSTIEHVAEIKYDKQNLFINIPNLKVGKCSECFEVYFDLVSDAQINDAFRERMKIFQNNKI